ncbi:hypothetical protein FKX85_11325 [Echinicola soli]|uniref:DUF5683 domain-containing protein n=1 Tax=Echinicola soli TaxID=2591634 RepID=A0A514CP24_9BACT|nr:hypothetical protein FKX85_11325 [Echinicola soli]
MAVFVLFLLFQNTVFGQEVRAIAHDSTEQVEININKGNIKNPKKAALLSAILPGAGQVYNEKMWKVPIIYGGIITTAYFVEFNNRRYQIFKEALTIYRDDDESTDNIFPNLNEDGLIRNVDYWRRNRDACYLVFTAIYALNIVDALVDAHLSGFDVSNDLTFKLEPSVEPTYASRNAIGLSFKIQFK